MERRLGVLVMCDPHDTGRGSILVGQLVPLGFVVTLVTTPGEALWHLEARQPAFGVLVVDGDGAQTDRFELLMHLRDTHPLLKRFLAVSTPAASELHGCHVVDKHRLSEAFVAFGLAAPE